MNLIVFPVGSTNIFPVANSHSGGQLLTEYNLRSRETVMTDESVTYPIGMSYTHSLEDFKVTYPKDSNGTNLGSTSGIQISPGRAVINGHYVESAVPIVIDMLDVNSRLMAEENKSLLGRLKVGIYMAYSTEQTLAGSLEAEITETDGKEQNVGYYRGVQIVILPENEFKLPTDCPTDETQVTAHILLASFTFSNGEVISLQENTDRIQCISFSRISNFSASTQDEFITRKGLQQNHLYVIPGTKPEDDCSLQVATGSLFKWENTPTVEDGSQSTYDRDVSKFERKTGATTEGVDMRLVHLQNASWLDVEGNVKKFADTLVPLPNADFSSGEAGVVTGSYTNAIKAGLAKIEEIYHFGKGTVRGYVDVLNDFADLPAIQSSWKPGDCILVRQDTTQIIPDDSDTYTYPSTLYVVLPGFATETVYQSQAPTGEFTVIGEVPLQDEWDAASEDPLTLISPRVSFDFSASSSKDYIIVNAMNGDDEVQYYYKVTGCGAKAYDENPIYITGGTYLATAETIGGFYNIDTEDTTYFGNGYVALDSSGHLRVVDYDLLVTGVLAYQLGQDVSIPAGLETSEIQSMLDQYVNQRVAFPALLTTSGENVVNVTIDLSSLVAGDTLEFGDIDSRFGTVVNLHLTGECEDTALFKIKNCEKLRLLIDDACNCAIQIKNCCIHYDSGLVDKLGAYLSGGYSDATTWYMSDISFFADDTDPFIVEGGNKVIAKNILSSLSSNTGDWWSSDLANDNRYMWATRSLTFSEDGQIIGIEMYMASGTTNQANLLPGLFLTDWQLSTSAFSIPTNCITGRLDVTGSFVSAYISNGNVVKLQNVTFSATIPKNAKSGNIVIYSMLEDLPYVTGIGSFAGDSITTLSGTGFEPGTYHLFSGGLVE